MPAGRVRAYVSGLYQEVYDAAYAAKRPHLDVRILLPREAASGGNGGGGGGRRAGVGVAVASPSVVVPAGTGKGDDSGADGTSRGVSWSTKDAATLEPDLEVLLSDKLQADEQVRSSAGYIEAIRKFH